ncbi:dimethylsulfonioproprionate lyase family protein [Hypericibacter sp.]|uniref:dimethylsulfonioproprionate lyase family protein n=1 Tax=Hypericibacter sp. TaxID=2705401 RepID=UPI003D6D3482
MAFLPGAVAEAARRFDLPWEEILTGPWTSGSVSLPAEFEQHSAVLELAGPDGIAVCRSFRWGLYLQSPAAFYPPHAHEADELYLVLSGVGSWQQDSGPPENKAPGSLIYHAPNVLHSIRSAEQPMLALWLWTGNIDYQTYRLA